MSCSLTNIHIWVKCQCSYHITLGHLGDLLQIMLTFHHGSDSYQLHMKQERHGPDVCFTARWCVSVNVIIASVGLSVHTACVQS